MCLWHRDLSDLKSRNLWKTSSFNCRWWNMVSTKAVDFLKLKHHLHSSFEKSIIERTMQYIKDRTESFDDYFPCKKRNAN